jgi:predicted RNA-binding Zn ribbon-like protein
LVVTTKTAADLELAGGNLALDLANTRDGHAPARDYLETPDDLVAWAQHAAGLTVDADAEVLARVLELREVVEAVFRPLATGGEPSAAALADLIAFQAPGRLVRAGVSYALTWDRDIVGPVASAAVDLLRRGRLDRLKLCDACPWLFLDLSRNHSRRWCSMNVCGGTRKMRRYRARKRATADRRSNS